MSAPSLAIHRNTHNCQSSLRALEWTNFFLADVQTGLGPFVAAYLAALGWKAGAVGTPLTLGGAITVLLQTPAGWVVDQVARKRMILILASLVLASGAILLATSGKPASVYAAESLIGIAAPFLGPTVAAITIGITGPNKFDRQFGRNQGFNAAGNLFAAAVMALASQLLGNRAIFYSAAVVTLPTIAAVLLIRKDDIDFDLARGADRASPNAPTRGSSIVVLLRDRVLLAFLCCAFLFHFANAAMLPQLGEILAKGAPRAAAPFMSACIAITQLVILLTAAYFGAFANRHGRKPLLLLAFGILPVRAALYALLHAVPALLAVQVLDGIANYIFGVVSILVIADRTRGSGRFNLTQGALATAVGTGAALSNTFGGVLMEHSGYRISFLALGSVAALAFVLFLLAVPETLIPHTGSSSPGIATIVLMARPQLCLPPLLLPRYCLPASAALPHSSKCLSASPHTSVSLRRALST